MLELNALGTDWNMVLVIQENTDSDPAKTYELAYRLIAKNGGIGELLNLPHGRPLSVSLRSSYKFFSFSGLIYPVDTGFCNMAFYPIILISPGCLLMRAIRVTRQWISELDGWG